LVKIAEELDSLGKDGMSAILQHAKDLLEEEQNFHYLKETGENIEELFKESLEEEGIEIGVNHLGVGAHDFELYKLDEPDDKVFVEIKSFKHGTRYPFKFASSQVKKSIDAEEDFFVCMLERPDDNEPATVDYLRENLKYKSNVKDIMENAQEDISAFEKISAKQSDVKLVLNLRDKPRVHVDFSLMNRGSESFENLINQLKERLE